MYRTNEATLVSAVLERKLANDPAGAIDAAVQLWLAKEEQPGVTDGAHDEAWSALTLMDLRTRAADAAVVAMRKGERIRFQAFIDVGESVSDPEVNKELAQLALEHRWGADYVFASLMRLVEAHHEAVALGFIHGNAKVLTQGSDTWSVIAALMTTTRVGKNKDLSTWFESLARHTGVPMWIAQAYASTIWEPSKTGLERVTAFASDALASCETDTTAPYFHAILAIDDLRARRDEEFHKRMTEHGPALGELAALAKTGGLDHPATRYVNRVKHTRKITLDDLTWEPLDTVPFHAPGMIVAAIKAVNEPKRPPNAKEGALLRDLVRLPVRLAAVLPMFVAMHELPKGSPDVSKLCVDMRKSRPSEMPWLVPFWDRLVKERVGWGARVKLALGLDV